jgi:hypothetical protein
MSAKELPKFYEDFGVNDAISKFYTHIGTCSYVVQLSENVRLLALNDDKNEYNHAGFTEEHFQWIEAQIKQAYDDNCLIIGMEHHLLMPHINSLVTGGACVAKREYVASRLADAGLKYIFVGHSHIQATSDFKSPNGNTITEVNVGSLVGYPAPIVNVTVNDDMSLTYEVDHLEQFTLDGESVDAQEFLKKHALDLIGRVLDAPNQDEFADRLTALQLDGNKFKKLYPIIKPVANLIKNGTVSQLYKKLKYLGVARDIDKNLVEKFADKKVMDFVNQILLSALDGSITRFSRCDYYYLLVMSVVSIPSKILKKNTDMKKLIFTIDAILTGGKFNNQRATI